MANKFLNLLAAATLAVVACSYGVQPGAALTTGHAHGDVFAHGHSLRRSDTSVSSKRSSRARRAESSVCKVRDESSSSSTNVVTTTSTKKKHQPTSTSEAPVETTAASSDNGNSSGGGSSGSYSRGSVNTSGDSPCSNKVGFSWNMGDRSELSIWSAGGGRCAYTWSSWPLDTAANAGSVVLPMLWGNDGNKISEFEQNMPKYKDTVILGFNEPNEGSQSNMKPSDAVALWWKHMEPQVQNGHRLCSPAVSSAQNGFPWMQEFMSSCEGCHISCVSTHWYGTSAKEFIAYQQKFLDEFGLPLLVTEFACHRWRPCDDDDAWNFLKTATAWLNGESRVWGYMAFGSLDDMVGVSPADQLLDVSNYEPNSLGWAYLDSSF
ncbi:glycosyl hydrolase catalytic core-domain-containing protein [Mucidula mucida]|nr:glycosyl hydrolase catalytic core-domain-containing protein [Mucidula mucida]